MKNPSEPLSDWRFHFRFYSVKPRRMLTRHLSSITSAGDDTDTVIYLLHKSPPSTHSLFTLPLGCLVFRAQIDFSRSHWWETSNFLMENQRCTLCVSVCVCVCVCVWGHPGPITGKPVFRRMVFCKAVTKWYKVRAPCFVSLSSEGGGRGE